MLRPLSREASLPVELDRVGDRFLLTWRGKLTAASLLAALTWLAGVIQDLLLYRGPHPDFSHKIWFLDVDVEQSAFTWISVVALFSAAAILLHNADRAISARRRFVWHWYVLAAVFLFLSFDEFGGFTKDCRRRSEHDFTPRACSTSPGLLQPVLLLSLVLHSLFPSFYRFRDAWPF